MLQFLHFLKSLLKVLKPSHKLSTCSLKNIKLTNRQIDETFLLYSTLPRDSIHPRTGWDLPLFSNLIQNRRYPSSVLLYTPGELEEYYKRDMNRQEQTRINKNSREQTRIDKNGQEQTRIDKNRQEQARIDKNRQEQTRIDKNR